MPREQKRSRVRFALLSLCVFSGLALAVAAGFSYYYLTDTERLKPLLVDLTARFTGRTLVIGGPLELEVSLSPRITAQRIQLSNASWAAEPDLLTADYLMLQIDLADLLDGRVNLRNFDARGMHIHLEHSADGRGNWQLLTDRQDEENDQDSPNEKSDLSFIIQGLELQDIMITARLAGIEPFDLVITKLVESTDSLDHLTLNGDGTLNDDPWQITGIVGPLDQLLSSGRIDADFDLLIHTTTLSVQGRVDDLANLEGIDITLTMQGPDARFYGQLLGMPELFEGDILLNGALRPSTAGYDFELSGHIARFEVQTDLTISDLRSFAGIAGTLHTSGPEASAVGKALGITGLPDGPFRIDARGHLAEGKFELSELNVETARSQLTAQASFPAFPETDGGRANLHIEGSDLSRLQALLGLSPLPAGPYSLTADLQAESGQVSAKLSFGSHHIEATGTLGDEPGLSGLQLAIEASGEDYGEISQVFNRTELHGPYSASWTVSVDRSAIDIRDFKLHNGPLRITGSSHLPALKTLEGFSASISFQSPSLAEVGTYLEFEGLPDRTVDANIELRVRNGRYDLERSTLNLGRAKYQISGTLGRLDSLQGLALDLDVTAPGLNDVLLQDLPEGYGHNPLHSTYRLIGHENALEIADFVMEAAGSRLALQAFLALTEKYIGSHMEIHASGPRLAALLPPAAGYQPPAVPYRISGRLELPAEDVLSFADFQLTLGSASASIDGTIDLTTLSKTDLTVNAQGGSLSELGRINTRALPDIPFEVHSSLTGEDDSIEISSLTLRWGDSDLQGSGQLEFDGKPRLMLRGVSDRLNVVALQEILAGSDPVAADPASRSATGKLIPDIPVPFETLAKLDADIGLSIGSYEGRSLRFEGVDLSLELEDGGIELERFVFKDAIGSFNVSGSLRPDNDSGRFALKVTGTDANLGILVAADQPEETIPRFSIDVDVEGSGTSVSEIAGNLSGSVLFYSDGGQISNAALQIWSGDFLNNLVKLLNPFTAPTDLYTPVDCVVVNAKLESGLLLLAPGGVMRTDKVNMFVFGKANLADEQLDLLLATQARQGIGISAASITNPYFKVGGSFAKPALEMDTKNAALAAGFATATGGLSILAKGFWDRVRGQRNPCPDFMPES